MRRAWPLGVALMGSMALAAACAPSGVTPTATAAIADSADMVMLGMERVVLEDGVRRAVIRADTAYTYQSSQLMEFRTLTVTFYDAAGVETSTLTAAEGTYRILAESLDARGQVRVVTPDGRQLQSERLRYERAGNHISTDLAFTFQSPTEYLEGNGFRSDPEMRNTVVDQPRGRQRGQGIALPGQVP